MKVVYTQPPGRAKTAMPHHRDWKREQMPRSWPGEGDVGTRWNSLMTKYPLMIFHVHSVLYHFILSLSTKRK